MLFIVYVNDTDGVIAFMISKFSHDTKIYSDIMSDKSFEKRKDDHGWLENLSNKCLMSLNAIKSKEMNVSYQNSQVKHLLQGDPFNRITSENDLGFAITNYLRHLYQ